MSVPRRFSCLPGDKLLKPSDGYCLVSDPPKGNGRRPQKRCDGYCLPPIVHAFLQVRLWSSWYSVGFGQRRQTAGGGSNPRWSADKPRYVSRRVCNATRRKAMGANQKNRNSFGATKSNTQAAAPGRDSIFRNLSASFLPQDCTPSESTPHGA